MRLWHQFGRIRIEQHLREGEARAGRGSSAPRRLPRAALVTAGLGVVYVVWGSTYFAIRVAIDTIPPLLLISVRFLLAGSLLYLWLRTRHHTEAPTPAQWRAAALLGATMILGGNAGVAWAEQHVPSGMVALLVATIPLFMAALSRLLRGERLGRLAGAGLALGFIGVVGLVGLPEVVGSHPLGPIVPLAGALAWSAGSLYAVSAARPVNALQGTAMQMLAGGAITGLVALSGGELGRFEPSRLSGASLFALGYLVVFGTLLAFTTYLWLLRTTASAVVSTYAFVNPLVAVFLGWSILDEPVTASTLASGTVILAGVVLMLAARAQGRNDSADGPLLKRSISVPHADAGRGPVSNPVRAA